MPFTAMTLHVTKDGHKVNKIYNVEPDNDRREARRMALEVLKKDPESLVILHGYERWGSFGDVPRWIAVYSYRIINKRLKMVDNGPRISLSYLPKGEELFEIKKKLKLIDEKKIESKDDLIYKTMSHLNEFINFHDLPVTPYGGLFQVALLNKKIVAFLGFDIYRDKLDIMSFWTDKRYRNQGIQTDFLENIFESNDIETFIISTEIISRDGEKYQRMVNRIISRYL